MNKNNTTDMHVYAFRRKGQDAFCTCDLDRYEELSQNSLFDTAIFYTDPQPCPAPESAIVPPVVQAPMNCTRSHPHENMGADCEAKTIVARHNNVIACLQKISEFCPPDVGIDQLDDSPEMQVRLHNAEIGDTARAAIKVARAILTTASNAGEAAPIVATVPSEQKPIAMIDPERIATLYGPIGACAVHATLYQPGMNYNDKATLALYAAPSAAAEQASDVRNAALEEAAAACDHRSEEMAWASSIRQGEAINCAKLIRALKSATPADKGNAPAEAKS